MYMKSIVYKIFPHVVVVILFTIIALAFFSPVLQGKKMLQSDIVQYTGMAKERNDFRQNHESYWTNSAFGGMPTYQLGAKYPHNYIKSLDKVIRFLPRPADYLFLYFIGFYTLLLVLRTNYRYAFLGALAFGFSTYLIIILGVGHNAKAHAIGYFPFVLAGIILAFQRKYLLGFLLTTIALALEINANHYQMTYYLLLLVLILGGMELGRAIRRKQLKIFVKIISVLVGAAVFSLLLNATSLLATQEYAQFSTRSKSELTFTPEGTPKNDQNGLSKDYITEYSYGVAESINLIVPRLFGGANNENVGVDSKTYNFLIYNGYPSHVAAQFTKNLPTYWGSQPIVAAPAYIGIIVFFLFVLGIFVVKNEAKWWLLGGTILSLLLSWGKNFDILTNFMIDYFPLYNKFRAVSSIQVILELCIPVLAILGLYSFVKSYKSTNNIADLKKNDRCLFYAFGITTGILLLLFIFKGAFSFVGINDDYYAQSFGSELMQVIREDRKAMYSADILRNLLFVCVAFAVLWIFTRKKLSESWVLIVLAILISVDLIGVAKRYVNDSNFVAASEVERPFQLSEAEQKILSDKSNFRVFSVHEALNGARTSYFFHSIGGYHAAKPRRLQELFDYQIYKGNFDILNMFNVKYLIQTEENNQQKVSQNPNALGNAWFVSNVKIVSSADQVMKALDTLNPSKTAIWQTNLIEKQVNTPKNHYSLDSLATIRLEYYSPDKLIYISENQNDGFAVFSEIFYKNGWVATIDETKADIHRVNYTLRGMEIPAGKHTIEFRFEPQVVKTGSFITLFSNVLLVILLVSGGISYIIKSRKK